jgi:hypothetical protein
VQLHQLVTQILANNRLEPNKALLFKKLPNLTKFFLMFLKHKQQIGTQESSSVQEITKPDEILADVVKT